MRFCFFLIGLFTLAGAARAAPGGQATPVPAEPLRKELWPAHWITHPAAPKNEYGVYRFRKELELAERPARFVVHVSADARYRLFVNGESVCFGPQRSDAWVWHYETVDLAPWLRAGVNVVAAEVWSYGELTPYAIVGVRTSFLLQGDTPAERAVDTDATWRVARDEAFSPVEVNLKTYIVVGPGARVDAAAYPWGWDTDGFDDAGWRGVRVLARGNPYGRGTDMDHWLKPRSLPLMEETPVRFAAVRRASGVEPAEGFLAGRAPLVVAAGEKATVLLDHGVETNAFPQLVVSGGRGGRVRLTYAEALVDDAGHKGDRNEVDRRRVVGLSDEFLPDGGARRMFSPLDFRTYRYVELELEAGPEPLSVDDIRGVFTAYPFHEHGRFVSDDAGLGKIWEVGWRTARLCAFETYVDCPYYEQLQYVGDTRIQALISLYVSGDDRLMRNAIELYDRSRIAEGLTQSRYPSVTPQVINTFSLWWVEMVHDYWMHRPDEAFVRERLPGIEAVLGWFERRIDASTGLLGPLDYWTFVDWTDEWKWDGGRGIGGEPPGAHTGGSAIVTLQLAGTAARAAELCGALGRPELATRYAAMAQALNAAVVKLCWDDGRKLFSDTPEKAFFSQHANTLAVLSGAIEGGAAKELIGRVAEDASLVQASTYFRFYLLRAMKHAGLGELYLEQLGPWHTMLERGLTTFAEKEDPTRSDCHAWSASPVYELLATVAGVEPGAPGFATVRIAPHLGALKEVHAVVPHPRGEIRVELEREGDGLRATVNLPAGVSGELLWKGERLPLEPGERAVRVEGR